MVKKSKPPLHIRGDKKPREDITKIYGEGGRGPFHPGIRGPPLNQPIAGVPDFVGVYRSGGKLVEFDTRDPDTAEKVLAVMRSIQRNMEQYPDYLEFLSNQEYFSRRLLEINEGTLFQRLSICAALWALEEGKYIRTSWEMTYEFIMRRGVARPRIEYHLESDDSFIAREIEKFRVVGKPGVAEEQIREFFKSQLAGADCSKPEVMFKAAIEAARAGLVDLTDRKSKDLPTVKIK